MHTIPLFLFFFWLDHAACGILVLWPGILPVPPAVEAWSLNHWTAREIPTWSLLTHSLRVPPGPTLPSRLAYSWQNYKMGKWSHASSLSEVLAFFSTLAPPSSSKQKNSSTLLCPGSISKLPDPHHFQGSVVCIQILKDKIALRLRSMASLVVEFRLVTATDAWREKEERILPGSLNRTARLDTG